MASEPGPVERLLERSIFQSRWLMAPFYLGLIVSLFVLLVTFLRELAHFAVTITTASETDVIVGVLALVDLSLTGNLVLIIIFSGYENFVSRIDPEGYPDWPEWITKIDYAGLKQKLIASIVVISAIQVLKAFMNLDTHLDEKNLAWLVGIHLVFVLSGLLLALTDWLGEGSKSKIEEDKSKFRKR
ncbi:MAG TPA: TIGR00645 family protein [Xanthobacteraceae bacterium]|nr:TIGR00645 family protein [Xanthobacteraceae bacterium]